LFRLQACLIEYPMVDGVRDFVLEDCRDRKLRFLSNVMIMREGDIEH
jgi:hypothetical protein